MELTSRLLIDEPPLQVLPSLAIQIGLNEALVLQQFHYWLRRSNNIQDGYKWIYNSYPDWNRQFPFWSESTVKRTINSLEKQGCLISGNYNRAGFDKTKWYRIDYEKLVTRASVQIDPTSGSDCPGGSGQIEQTNTKRLPETTTETSSSSLSKYLNSGELNNEKQEEKEKLSAYPDNESSESDQAQQSLTTFWNQNGFGTLTDKHQRNIESYVNQFESKGASKESAYRLIEFALGEAVDANATRWNYVESTLKDYLSKNITTVIQAQTNKNQWQAQQTDKRKATNSAQISAEERLKQMGKESSHLPF